MNVAVFGAKGRVGSKVVELAKNHNVWQIDVGFEQNPQKTVDVAIDFSLPQATKRVVEFCKTHRCPLVTGVTGRTREQQALIDKLSQTQAVVAKDNFCQGIRLLDEICRLVVQQTAWDCDVVETHHASKKDSPSGTARMLATTVAKAKGSFGKVTVHSIRQGSNFGRHTVIFGTQGQSLTITHQAENVDIFAQGALDTALKVAKLQ